MTRTIEIMPSEAVRSECNERQEDVDEESKEFQHLLSTIESGGISNKPLARREDGDYAIVDGWNRVRAAEVAGLDKIEIDLQEMDDVEAMKKSLYGNMDEARVPVNSWDRALHISRIRAAMGGEEEISLAQLADEIGVNRSTLKRWLEPLEDAWEDTFIDPTSENVGVHREHLSEISETKLTSIRKTTGGGEAGEWLVVQTVENDLTMKQLKDIRDYVEDGVSIENAVGVVMGDLSETEVAVEGESEEKTEELTTESSQTASAELSQESGFSANSGSTTESESPNLPEEEKPGIDDDDWEVPERYRDRNLVATPEEIKAMLERQEKKEREHAKAEAEAEGVVFKVPAFTMEGKYALEARRAIEEDRVAEDEVTLCKFALQFMLRNCRFTR